MLQSLKGYYSEMVAFSKSSLERKVPKSHAISTLLYKIRGPEGNLLRRKLTNFPAPLVPIDYIERICLSLLTDRVLERYNLHISEAYVISSILLLSKIGLHMLEVRLTRSGLLPSSKGGPSPVNEPSKVFNRIIDDLDFYSLIHLDKYELCHPGKMFKDYEI